MYFVSILTNLVFFMLKTPITPHCCAKMPLNLVTSTRRY